MKYPSIFLAFALLGCGNIASEPAGVEATYGAAALTVLTPYPSNRYTVPDPSTATGLRVKLAPGESIDLVVEPTLEATVEELNQHDGFSTTGGLILNFSGPIDVTGLAPPPDGREPPQPLRDAKSYASVDSPLVLIDVDANSPEFGKARGLVLRYWQQAADDFYIHDDYSLVAQPAEPLRPRTRYLFALTDVLRAADGGAVHRSPLTQTLLTGGGAGTYESEVAAGLAVLESFGVSRERVTLASAFTTMTVHEPMLAVVEKIRAGSAPTLLEPWTVKTAMTAADKRVRMRAVFDTPEYRVAGDLRWKLDDKGVPIEQGRIGLEVFLTVSDGSAKKRRPVVIFQHGLGGDKEGEWGTAERLAELNAAVFSIDSPHHGSRAGAMASPLAATFSFFGIDADTQSFVIGRARDNFRQMSADQLGLVRLINSLKDTDLLPLGAPDGEPDFDTSHILYIGHSFGSVQGATLFATAPEVGAAVWNVGGDVLTTLLRDSNTFAILVNSLRPAGISDGEVARFFALIQAIVDPGDPINYARYGTLEALPGIKDWKPRDVLVQEVIDDRIVPNSTSEALARAAHLTLVDPVRPISGLVSAPAPLSGNLSSGATGAISQFDFVEGGKTAEHGALIFSPLAIAQYRGFFQSYLKDGRATVPPSYPDGHPLPQP